MKKKKLNELYWLNKEIEDLKYRLKELEETFISASKLDSEIHAIGEHGNPVEKLTIKIMELKNKIYKNMLTMWSKKEEIEEFIETIPDSKIRTIVRLRNIDLLSWSEIANRLGKDRKTVTNIYNTFINELRECIETDGKEKSK